MLCCKSSPFTFVSGKQTAHFCFFLSQGLQMLTLPALFISESCIKPFEAPQRSAKIKFKLIFSRCPGSGWEGLILKTR